MSEPEHPPRMFALTRGAQGSEQIVGYGLVLPDGSALSTSWPKQLGTHLYSTSSAQETAALRGANLHWINDQ